MAYDKAKAHQYYMEYRKKGLLKGKKKGKAKTSKKGSSKKAKTESIVKASSGLTVEGTIEANNIKANMKKEMNEALKGAKTDAEKKAIIAEYSKKQASALEALKKDSKYASAKTQKASSSKGSGKSSGGGKNGGSAKSSGSGSKSSEGKASTSSSTSTATTISPRQMKLQEAATAINDIRNMLSDMPPEQKKVAKEKLRKMIDEYMKLAGE